MKSLRSSFQQRVSALWRTRWCIYRRKELVGREWKGERRSGGEKERWTKIEREGRQMLFFFLVPVQRKKNFLVELLNSENRILLKDETSSVRYIWAKNPEPKIMQPSEDYSLLLTGQKYVDAYFLVERVILKKKKLSFLLSVRLQVCSHSDSWADERRCWLMRLTVSVHVNPEGVWMGWRSRLCAGVVILKQETMFTQNALFYKTNTLLYPVSRRPQAVFVLDVRWLKSHCNRIMDYWLSYFYFTFTERTAEVQQNTIKWRRLHISHNILCFLLLLLLSFTLLSHSSSACLLQLAKCWPEPSSGVSSGNFLR